MLLEDLEIYVAGLGKGQMFQNKLFVQDKLFQLGMPLSIAQETVARVTFANYAEPGLIRISKALMQLYYTTIEGGIVSYYHELERIGHIQ